MSRSKGCIPCKYRRKKCDEQKPLCAACIRNVLICAWGPSSDPKGRVTTASPEPVSFSRTRPSSGSNATASIKHLYSGVPDPHSLIQGPGSLHPQLRQSQAAFLYSFFLEKAAQTVSIRDERSNPFIHVLAPMALQSDMILHTILAFSGVVLLQGSTSDIAHAVWEQYAQALRSLKFNLTKYTQGEGHLAIHVLLTCLLLCALEVWNTDTQDRGLLHFTAAQQVVSTAEAFCSGSPSFSLAAELYSYIISLLPSCLDESAGFSFSGVDFTFNALMRHHTPFFGVLCGCAFSLLRLIPDVYVVSTAIHDAHQSGKTAPTEHYLSRQRLLGLVQIWMPEALDEEGKYCGLIYRLALLALLEIDAGVESTTIDPTSSYRRQLVANMTHLLRSLPVDSNYSTILCWPLAVLGSYAEESQHRDIILKYLFHMARKYRQGNMYQTIQLLRMIWDSPHLRRKGPRCLQAAMEAQGYRIMFT
ncbi:putative C6 finger domain protein [Aspergillus alliaceus]|uniref:Putative C6 finger domain protein n=1 Tax=Petromyces alliaceus TaxID=209559 RepID=A0A5N7BT71_PETAA|nr:putative C6 finger domain protein [Aspergillus alliaceus]